MAKKTDMPLPLPPGQNPVKIQFPAFPTAAMPAEQADQLRQARKLHGKGLEHARAKRWEEAALKFDEAARAAPGQPEFNYALGCALSQLGRLVPALDAFRRELAIRPGDGPALAEFGTCLARMGRNKEAIGCLQAVARHRPDTPFVYFNLGLMLLTENRRLEAIEAFTHMLAIDIRYADAYRMRGLAHAMGGDNEKAADDLQAAAALDINDHRAMLRLGDQLSRKSRELDAGRLFEMAAKAAPKIALPQCIFGHFLVIHRRYELGLSYIERAIKLDPFLAGAHDARAYGLLGQGRIDEAVASYRRAGELKPDSAEIAGNLLFALQHKRGVTKTDLLEAHKRWAALYRPQAPRNRLAFANDPDPGRKLRIGVVSADMRRHAVAFLTLRAFEQLAALEYEIFCYKTDRRYPDDAFSDRYKAVAKSWHEIGDLDDAALAAVMAEQKIDILFDLSGHTAGSRLSLFAARVAPVQLTWAGYVGTVGLDTYDGIIADPVEIPPGHDEFYVEPVIRLPDCYVCYDPPVQAPEPDPLPFFRTGTFTFGCFNRPAKLNTDVARAWSQILARVPGARILMVYGAMNEKSTQDAVYRILESGGVKRDRVDLVGEIEQSKLLEAYARKVDLALDPFPYSGGVTTLEAMWMGVPTVTFAGETFAGRHSATHLTAAGLGDFCTNSIEAYIDLAVAWTKRPHDLAALRTQLRQRVAKSPLNDQFRFGDHLDAALRRLWQDWCRSKAVQG
jgi:predicted O-linked N-acetylglucosamine transferase (SPINDLY family)